MPEQQVAFSGDKAHPAAQMAQESWVMVHDAGGKPYRRNVVVRVLLVWLVLIAAETVHGILRAIALVPYIGQSLSSQIGVFTGSAIILVIACLTIRWIGAATRRELLLAGLVWLVLTVAFEVLVGRFAMGATWERIAADYNVARGGLMPLGLLVLFLAPLIASKWRSTSL